MVHVLVLARADDCASVAASTNAKAWRFFLTGWSRTQVACNVRGHVRRLLANIRHGDDLPVAALGERSEGPQPIAADGPRMLVDLEADAQLIRSDLTGIEQAAEQ